MCRMHAFVFCKRRGLKGATQQTNLCRAAVAAAFVPRIVLVKTNLIHFLPNVVLKLAKSLPAEYLCERRLSLSRASYKQRSASPNPCRPIIYTLVPDCAPTACITISSLPSLSLPLPLSLSVSLSLHPLSLFLSLSSSLALSHSLSFSSPPLSLSSVSLSPYPALSLDGRTDEHPMRKSISAKAGQD